MTNATTKERPILFSGEMVTSILAGNKSQTRRVMKPQPTANLDWVTEWGWTFFTPDKYISGRIRNPRLEPREIFLPCPYSLGQRLWVRETWAIFASSYDFEYGWEGEGLVDIGIPKNKPESKRYNVVYAADGYQAEEGEKWRPSIHMPRWASRITLEVVSVKVERVQDISIDDVLTEGIERDMSDTQYWRENTGARFVALWDSINAKRGFGWDTNPYVWAIEFKRVQS